MWLWMAPVAKSFSLYLVTPAWRGDPRQENRENREGMARAIEALPSLPLRVKSAPSLRTPAAMLVITATVSIAVWAAVTLCSDRLKSSNRAQVGQASGRPRRR